jgi:hypothetical protein
MPVQLIIYRAAITNNLALTLLWRNFGWKANAQHYGTRQPECTYRFHCTASWLFQAWIDFAAFSQTFSRASTLVLFQNNITIAKLPHYKKTISGCISPLIYWLSNTDIRICCVILPGHSSTGQLPLYSTTVLISYLEIRLMPTLTLNGLISLLLIYLLSAIKLVLWTYKIESILPLILWA